MEKRILWFRILAQIETWNRHIWPLVGATLLMNIVLGRLCYLARRTLCWVRTTLLLGEMNIVLGRLCYWARWTLCWGLNCYLARWTLCWGDFGLGRDDRIRLAKSHLIDTNRMVQSHACNLLDFVFSLLPLRRVQTVPGRARLRIFFFVSNPATKLRWEGGRTLVSPLCHAH